MRLWEACQLPDFQKTTLDEHARLSRDIFHALTGKRGRLTEDWIGPRFADVDRDDGQIDQLSARLSAVRTLSYIANRPDWLDQAQGWRDRTRALEDRLSDVLHERLTARFVDRKTTALMRSLNDRDVSLAEVATDGVVTVDGEAVGPSDRASPSGPRRAPPPWPTDTLKTTALRAVGPEIARRLGRLAADPDEAFSLTPDGHVLWNGAIAARILSTATGADPFAPQVRLLGELGPAPARERARRRIEAWAAAEAGRALRDLRRLKQAVETGSLKGLPRGIAFRLIEAGGADRPARRRARPGRPQPGRAPHPADLRHPSRGPFGLAAWPDEAPRPRLRPGLYRPARALPANRDAHSPESRLPPSR